MTRHHVATSPAIRVPVIWTAAIALLIATSFHAGLAQAQDRVLEAAQQAQRLQRPILFEGDGGYRLYEQRTGKDRLAYQWNPVIRASLSESGKLLAVGSYEGGNAGFG